MEQNVAFYYIFGSILVLRRVGIYGKMIGWNAARYAVSQHRHPQAEQQATGGGE